MFGISAFSAAASDSPEEDQTAEVLSETKAEESDYMMTADGGILFTDDNRFTKTTKIRVPFCTVTQSVAEYDFPYTDDFFRYPSGEFNKTIAQASLGFALSAFRNEEEVLANQYETYLEGAGFSDIYSFGYDKETSVDTLSGVIAHKKIDDFTVIACTTCGQGYKKEWSSNLMVGDASRHVGFNNAAKIFEREITNYANRHGLSGNVKLWLAGFSRASAISNLTAADLKESGRYDDIYAYLFGVPNTTRNPVAYDGIFNICGQYDPVTGIPLRSWGYERYGHDIYTPSQEADVDYSKMKAKASVVSEEVSDNIFRNNPETNHQIHMLLEFLGEMFPAAGDYSKKMQPEAMKIWTEANQEQIFEVLIQLMNSLDELDAREEYSRKVFIDYISYVASEHLQGNKRQIADGYWDANASVPENVLREHNPITYISWVFSDIPSTELYAGSYITRLFSITGKVGVEVYQGDLFVASIDKNGKTRYASDQEDVPVVYMMRRGDETRLSLPTDTKFTLYITADRRESVIYYDTLYAAGVPTGINQYSYFTILDVGRYQISADELSELTELQADSGRIISNYKESIQYSTLVGMAMESSSVFHITPSFLFGLLSFSLAGFILLIVVCAIIAIIHAIRKRKKQKEYSPLWVIIPHIILIAFFAILTQFFTFNLYAIGMVKTILATAAILFIFLLALRAFIKNRDRINGMLAGGTLILTVLTYLFYKNSFFADYSTVEMVIYVFCIVVLTLLAALGFYRKNKADKDMGAEYNKAQSENAK